MRRSVIFLFFLPGLIWAQSAQLEVKENDRYAFGQIYAGFRYCFQDDYSPQAAFEFNQGIMGYFHRVSPSVSGMIMLDVTRTTHILSISDTNGIPLSVDYFEGSKYTAYLKMAEIKWDFHPNFALRFGQLLNTQYLTFQDPFWGYRYIDVTFQERFRLGMPADFGAQLDFHYKGKILNQFSIVNGEGPFRYQDIDGQFIFSENLQYSPVSDLTLKLYVDYGPSRDTSSQAADRSAISAFAGYKTDRFRVGVEYDHVFNQNWKKDIGYSGWSAFVSFTLNKKIDFLARFDHLRTETPAGNESFDYLLAGFQYQPVKALNTSLNFRYLSDEQLPFIYASFGLKF